MSGFGDIIMSKVEEYEKKIDELMSKSSIRAKKKYDGLMGNSVLRCPICGSERIVELPDNSLLEGNCRRHLYSTIGGKPTYEYEYEHHCLSCEHDFGAYPKIVTLFGELEDVRTCVEAIYYNERCGRNGRNQLAFENNKDGIWVKVYNPYSNSIMQREMASDEWIGLIDRLYGKLYLHEWEQNFRNPYILDGRNWRLKVFFRDGYVHEYNGENAYPPYWEGLCATLRPFFLEFDILW